MMTATQKVVGALAHLPRKKLPTGVFLIVVLDAWKTPPRTAPWPTIHAFVGKRLTEDPIVRCSICLVAAARSGLEPSPIKNSDVAAAVTDQIARLQGTRRLSDADAAHAKHEGQKLLG